ncbi:RHS repeat domain-containing protein [Luteimonas sp. RIT-PG2_3]
MKSWIQTLILCLLVISGAGYAQSMTISAPGGTSYPAPASFSVTVTLKHGTGSNKYRIQSGSVTITRNNQTIASGGTSHTESSLPVGTYTYQATATAMHTVTLHEMTVTSDTVTVTVTTPPPPSGSIAATPNPCSIAPGNTTCATSVSWNSANATNASVWVSDRNNNGLQLFASGATGAQAASITVAGSRFHLRNGSQTLATRDVLANAPPPSSGTISASPNPCSVSGGSVQCLTTISWNSVNAPTATVWVSDLNNAGMAPFGNTPNGSQGTMLNAGVAKRYHLIFAGTTLATVDARANPLPPPSGTITASPSSCTVNPCTVTINWGSFYTTEKVVVLVTDLNGNSEQQFASGPSGSKTISVPSTGLRFHLKQVKVPEPWLTLATVNIQGVASPTPTYLHSKVETFEYHDDTSKWVLDQVKRSATNGIEAVRIDYDTATVLPVRHYAFGKLQQTLTYNASGNVATVKDGNNNVTTLSAWKRGVPQTIQHPATPESASGAIQSAVVHNNGWITSVTDENNFTTSYTYDAMGRLKDTIYPTGDTTVWHTTTRVFEPVAAAEYGIPAGHWRQTVSTGNARKITYFDGLWRPLVTREYDTAAEAITQRFQRFTYDHEGRVTFASYPSAVSSSPTGTWSNYDVLGRIKGVRQDWEGAPQLPTVMSYLSNADGHYTLVTDPRGNKDRTWYQSFDQPNYDRPVMVYSDPANSFTHIARDVFGKPTQIMRSNSISPTGGTVALNRTYTYNTNQELCRVVEPETGVSLMGYDAAGNLRWSASGLPPTFTGCHATGVDTAITARKATRTYDARNRVKTIAFPDSNANQTWNYTPDGLASQVTTLNTEGGTTVVNSYTYNRRRLLTQETQDNLNEISGSIGYTYNQNGHLSAHTYPTSLPVAYAPNALGQPTQAGTYATGVTYHPNGAIKQFTYGNGIVHTLTQNARGLPDTSCDYYGTCNASAVLNDGYDYDGNANVAAISDGRTGSRGNRTMTYDAQDRLIETVSPMFGTAIYTYDVLDNLTRVQVGATANLAARDHHYCYDSAWRLTNIKTSSCTTGATVTGLGYDVQGNLANKNGLAYTFDYGNRLRLVMQGSTWVESYRYDAHGRRVRSFHSGGVLRSFYGQDGALRFQRNEQTGKDIDHILLNGSLVATREVPIAGGAAVVKYQHTDALGSPVAITDASGMVIERSEYEPYGRVGNRAARDGVGYTGHVEDAATSLTYMQQRYYDPQIGLFLSVDPVTAYSNPVGQFHRYRYANNNPYKFMDPDGRFSRVGSSCNVSYCKQAGLSSDSSRFEGSKGAEGANGNVVSKVSDAVRSRVDRVVDGVKFGANAVADGVSEDYRKGGALGVVIGATGGRSGNTFFGDVEANFRSTSLTVGPIDDVDKKLVGLGVGSAMAKRYGGYTFGQLLFNGPAKHLGTYGASARLAAFTTATNGLLIGLSWESGTAAGSIIRTSVNRAARTLEGED